MNVRLSGHGRVVRTELPPGSDTVACIYEDGTRVCHPYDPELGLDLDPNRELGLHEPKAVKL